MEWFWPKVMAEFDDEGVWVYQAFKDTIADAALEKGTFGRGFSLERMTWIKPSLGWMMYRSGFASKARQTRVLRIKVSREGFDAILEEARLTHYVPEVHDDYETWAREMGRSKVRCQWDPERDLRLRPTGERAIQLGLTGEFVSRYVDEWIVGVEDRTWLAHELGERSRARLETTGIFEPREYAVSEGVAQRLGVGRR